MKKESKSKEEPNELKMPVELSDDALDNIIGGLRFTVDRIAIQKEIDQSIAQIDDNVLKQTAQSTVAHARKGHHTGNSVRKKSRNISSSI